MVWCRWARQVSAVLLIAAVAVIVVLDVIADDYEVNPPVLVPLLLKAAACSRSTCPGCAGGDLRGVAHPLPRGARLRVT